MGNEDRLFNDADPWITAATVDKLLSLSPGYKYILMKRLFDPFPRPVSLGKIVRWQTSKVMAWKRRQEEASEIVIPDATPEVEREPTARALDDRALFFKRLYEEGESLDKICRAHGIGKQTLSDTLRAVNTRMRAVGRRSASVAAGNQLQP